VAREPQVADPWSSFFFQFLGVGWDRVHLVRRPLIGLLYQPWIIDEHREFGGMTIGVGNWSARKKPTPIPFYPPKKHITRPGLEPGPPPRKLEANRLSYGAAFKVLKNIQNHSRIFLFPRCYCIL
jgi:hypothetical protein